MVKRNGVQIVGVHIEHCTVQLKDDWVQTHHDFPLHLGHLFNVGIWGRLGTVLKAKFRLTSEIFPQLLSVRQKEDVVVHLPTTYNNSMSSLDMVIALHGMGPNYPDLFQHEVGWPSLVKCPTLLNGLLGLLSVLHDQYQ